MVIAKAQQIKKEIITISPAKTIAPCGAKSSGAANSSMSKSEQA